MTDELFRRESIRHRTRALFGDVILAAPITAWIFTLLILAIFVLLIASGLFITIETEHEQMPLWRWFFARNV